MRNILLKGPDVYNSTKELETKSEIASKESNSQEDVYACEGDFLMIQQTLNNQPSRQPES